MALTTCGDCGNQISTEASACPNCGKPLPKNRSPLKLFLIISGVLLLLISVVAFLVVVQKRNADIAKSEYDARTNARTITHCEIIYRASQGRFGDMHDLINAGLLDRDYAISVSGYHFNVLPGPTPSSFVVTAKPVRYGFWGDGRRSFYMSSDDSTIHAADKGGDDATASDPAETF